jgi:uncharacterized protein YcfJ
MLEQNISFHSGFACCNAISPPDSSRAPLMHNKFSQISNSIWFVSCAFVATLLAQSNLHAQAYASPDLSSEEAVSFGFAEVLRADPIVETVQELRPREVCEEVVTESNRRYENTNTGTIVGAVVGAALGNQVGSGDGRRAATVVGAVVGGAVGREADASNNPQGVRRSAQTECEVVDEYVERKVTVGYDVQYRYRGEVYNSRTDYDPGEKLRVRVAVSPAE